MPEQRRVVFRADASSQIGTGHVVRSLALAGELARRGWVAALAGRLPASLLERARDQGVAVAGLPDRLSLLDEPAHLAATGALAGVDLVVADHYGIGAAWHRAVAAAGPAVVAIDDLASVPLAVDLVLNQNLGVSTADYRTLVPPGAVVLAGPRFALLRPGFAEARATLGERTGDVRRLLVFLSGADEHDVTGRAARAATATGLEVDVVVGGAYAFGERLAAWAAGQPRVQLHRDTPAMPQLMAAADLAIGAPGSATWERCTLGLPTLLLILAANQEAIAARLAEAGAALSMGWHDRVSDEELETAISGLAGDAPRVRAMGVAAAAIADGRGAERVATALESLRGSATVSRPEAVPPEPG